MATTLTVYRGDTFRYTAAIANGDASPYDLTGTTVWWTLKRRRDDPDSAALVSLYWESGGTASGISVADPLTGEALVTMTPTQTDALDPGTYQWDVQVKDGNGDTWTVDTGPLVVSADVTRRRTTP